MEGYASMAWWHWNYCNSNCNISYSKKFGGMQLFQSEFSSKEEKVLPRTTKIATGIGFVYIILTLLCSILLYSSGMSFLTA